MSDDAEIVKEFLVESYENLDRLDQDLIALEKDPRNRDTLGSIFRTIHTIKGTSGFLAFNQLGAVTHVGESLLARLRDGMLPLNPEITTALLAMIDAVRQMLSSIEENGKEGERDDRELIDTLTRLVQASTDASPVPPSETAKQESKVRILYAADSSATPSGDAGSCTHSTVSEEQRPAESNVLPLPESLPEKDAAKVRTPLDVPAIQQQARGQSATDSTIRVDVSLLDQLMNLVGELVLARNQILQASASSEENGMLATSQRLNLITTELQEGVMKTRMQPIGNVWSKFPRTVRDVALGCGKQVQIEMEGKETELDKTIIEAIKDPLTHLVRNAVDHGIESPAQRQAVGKDPVGRLLLRAFHEGGQVNIEITDDGSGLNHEKIRAKAIQKALVPADQAARMSEREINNLIFLPGFSTAEKVTNVSGRGVGMDVVKTNIEKIGGVVDVQSKMGQGTTVRMKIPLTLAIIPALIVTTAGDRYAIPQVSLLELVRLEGEQARKGIELVHGAPVHRLRGKLLPLVYLNHELNVEANNQSDSKTLLDGLDFVVVRDKHRHWVATLQDVLAGRKEMTAQQAGSFRECALGKWLYSRGVRDYGMIHEMQLLQRTHQQFHKHVHNVLLANDAGDVAAALKELETVEQYSQSIMALISTVEHKIDESQGVNIVVLQADDRQFGLVVNEINDTEEIVVKPLGKQLKSVNIYAGATIMGDGRVALILDVLGLAQHAKVVGEAHDHAMADEKRLEPTPGACRRTMLLFQYGENGRMAIDLSMVARLEEFEREVIEIADGKEAVQYRGQIMPLVRVSEILHTSSADREPESSVQVVVYTDHERSIGLVIDRILDIVEDGFVIEPQTSRKGVLGSAVIHKRITDVLDVPALIAVAHNALLGTPAQA